MKRFLLSLFACTALLTAVPAGAGAQWNFFQDTCKGEAANSAVCKEKEKTQTTSNNSIYGPDGVIIKVANVVALAAGFAAVIFVIIGGIKYILSSGDPANIKSAKDTIIFAIIGIVVIAAARTIIGLVINAL